MDKEEREAVRVESGEIFWRWFDSLNDYNKMLGTYIGFEFAFIGFFLALGDLTPLEGILLFGLLLITIFEIGCLANLINRRQEIANEIFQVSQTRAHLNVRKLNEYKNMASHDRDEIDKFHHWSNIANGYSMLVMILLFLVRLYFVTDINFINQLI